MANPKIPNYTIQIAHSNVCPHSETFKRQTIWCNTGTNSVYSCED